MGTCLSCLGLGRNDEDEHDRVRLLYDDFGSNGHGYGTWSAGNVLSQNILSPEEVQREQEGLDKITNSATDKIIEIFPHGHHHLSMSTSQINGHAENGVSLNGTSHHDILLSLIPGDKSKRSIRIYPVSRPTSKDAQSLRSHSSFRGLNGTGSSRIKESGVLVKLDVNWP
ncbi:hypothetical protein PV10_06462 [Exophiala mesophila]|uniref:Uncharacterized protein n=1 Tax=Exophiala mesophila TaxID=212818 RepID=A0A0D1ZBB8_EXOME|nr:uncharacterized protein PV10_06462 [Exophiala mesophila]KIV91977.1 hypothetical protein PV10_06462 [Exophiala mesophila]